MNAIDALMQLLPLYRVPKLPTTTSYFEFSSELLLVRVSNVGSDRCNCQGNIRRVSDGPEGFSCLRTASDGELYWEPMNINYLPCLISILLVTGCTDLSGTATVATAPVPTPTPENYGFYTDSDLRIYADTIDLKIQQALKNNDASQAQELGRKRQELIAEFNRRHLKRSPAAPSGHPRNNHTLKRSGNGLPGEN